MWGYTFLVLLAILIWQTWKHDAKRGLGVAILLALLVPKWAAMGYQHEVGGIQLLGESVDMRVAISFVGLLVVACQPKTVLPLRFNWIDLPFLGIISIYVVSDSYHQGFSFGILARAFGEWCLPYLVGRTIVCNLDDVRGLANVCALVCTVLGLFAAVECIVRINLFELAYGNRPEDDVGRMALRWGFKRAFGQSMHPIYFGALQLLLCPWGLYAAYRSVKSGRGLWRLGAPAAGIAGIVATLSRAPMLAIAPLTYMILIILKPKWRSILLVVAAISVVALFIGREQVTRALQHWGGELDESSGRKVIIDDEEVRLTSTNSRIQVWKLYGLAFRRAGWLGYGSERVAVFPIRVPIGPHEARTLKRFRPVDNVYLLIALRFGYGAMLLFVCLGLLTAYTFCYLGVTQRQGGFFYAAMAGTTIATMFILWTVWMPHDFGFVFIMNSGVAASLSSRVKATRSSKNLYPDHPSDGNGSDSWNSVDE